MPGWGEFCLCQLALHFILRHEQKSPDPYYWIVHCLVLQSVKKKGVKSLGRVGFFCLFFKVIETKQHEHGYRRAQSVSPVGCVRHVLLTATTLSSMEHLTKGCCLCTMLIS